MSLPDSAIPFSALDNPAPILGAIKQKLERGDVLTAFESLFLFRLLDKYESQIASTGAEATEPNGEGAVEAVSAAHALSEIADQAPSPGAVDPTLTSESLDGHGVSEIECPLLSGHVDAFPRDRESDCGS